MPTLICVGMGPSVAHAAQRRTRFNYGVKIAVEDRRDNLSDEPLVAGRWIILVITLLALALASFNWFYRRNLGRQALEFWGPEAATLIARTPSIEVVRLEPLAGDTASPDAETITFEGQTMVVRERVRLDPPNEARGLSNIRASLLRDRAYAWDEAADGCRPRWQYALRFADDRRSVTVLVSIDCPRAALVGKRSTVSIRPIGSSLATFLEEQLSPARR